MLLTLLACADRPTEPTTGPTSTWDPDAPLAERCFDGLGDPANGAVPQYDAFGPEVPRHCAGTDHQDVQRLDRIVFLGDSITTGTPPTPTYSYYRNLLVDSLATVYGPLETQDCSEWGARVDDLLQDDDQLVRCLGDAGTDERATLVVFTMGGNDMFAFAQDVIGGGSVEDVDRNVDETVALFDDVLAWLDDARATRFPNGLHVVYGNLYEYTDGTGDLSVCPTAQLFGFDGVIPEVRDAYVRINEAWVERAVLHQMDVVFMLEHFCGHGFLAGDPANECYRGPGTETWFDPTCIHPTETGHRELAALFHEVVTF